MENEQIENLDSTNETSGNEEEVVIDDTLDTEARLQALEEQNKKLFARAKKAEELAKKAKERHINSEEKPKTYGVDDEVLELRLDGYKKDEVEFIMKNGGRNALNDPNSYVAIALNSKREQRRAEEAANQATDTAGLSEVERKYTPEQLKNMSSSDLEKILPHA